MKRLKIQQVEIQGLNFLNLYQFEMVVLKTNKIIYKDSIEDLGQGMEKATEQIHGILRRKGFIQ